MTAFIESEDASYLQRGSMLRCRVGGYLSQSWDMQVIQIGREAVPRPDLPASSRQVRVRCRPTSAAFPLAAGTEVDVDGEVPLVSGATLIPAAAVVHENGGDWVWVLVDGQVSRRQVVIGPNNFDEIVIREGIQPGELVVVGGKMGVEEGMVVNVKPMPPMTGVRPGGGLRVAQGGGSEQALEAVDVCMQYHMGDVTVDALKNVNITLPSGRFVCGGPVARQDDP